MTDAPCYLDRRISPRRALSPRGLLLLMGLLVAWNLVLCGFLLMIGAWPVPIFLGLDVLGLGAAFAVSNRRAGNGEHVRVTAERVTVERAGASWSAPTAWTRVDAPPRGSRAPLRLTSSGRATAVGAALGEVERRRFAQALEHAIASARAARW